MMLYSNSGDNNRYCEAIDYLYSSNTFVTSDIDVIEYLPLVLLPQRIYAIRSLRFKWGISDYPPFEVPAGYEGPIWDEFACRHDRWETVWHNLAMMRNLRSLCVRLVVSPHFWGTLNRESARLLLKPIINVKATESFILILPFPAMREGMQPVNISPWSAKNGWEGVDPWDELPCTIRRI